MFRSPASHGTALVDQAFRRIAPPRRNLYFCGMALTAIGVVLFGLMLAVFIANFGSFDDLADRIQSQGLRALGGLVLFLVGSQLMRIGYMGGDRSDLLSAPQRFRELAQPSSRSYHPVADADVLQVESAVATLVKVRCTRCQTLNDEDAKTCVGCGAAV